MGYNFLTQQLNDTYVTRLQRALELDEFVVYFQPIIDVQTEKIISCEALVKWLDSEFGLMDPSSFIPAMEQCELISDLDFCVFEKVCRWISERLSKGEKVVPVSCNFSRQSFKDEDFHIRMKNLVEKYDIPTEYLAIEITESVLLENSPTVEKNIADLAKAEMRVFLDDFGSGFTCYFDLQYFPVNYIKIDKLLLHASESFAGITILENIIDLGHGLGMRVLCEGAETPEQVARLKSLNCDEVQGFFYYRPMTQAKLEGLLETLK